jgi:adenylate kinase
LYYLFCRPSESFGGFVILLLFGPPGCGKGTQAAFLAERFHIPAISTGEMFRAECQAGTEMGRLACSAISKGDFVSDDVVEAVVASRTARPDCANGFLLDGFPRTVPQAIWFADLVRQRGLPDPVVMHLDVADEALVARLTARRQCPKCLRIYNLLSVPPVTPGICDHDQSTLIRREDDCEEVIRRRLRAYDELTGPILKWYGPKRVHSIDGSLPAKEVRNAALRVAMDAACAYA